MRRPEDEYISIEASSVVADKIEELLGPNLTLARFPDDLQAQGEDATPSYFVAITDAGVAATQEFPTGNSNP